MVRLLFAAFGDLKPFESLSSETSVNFYQIIRHNIPEDSPPDNMSFTNVTQNIPITETFVKFEVSLP
jgi:hypothetical protein